MRNSFGGNNNDKNEGSKFLDREEDEKLGSRLSDSKDENVQNHHLVFLHKVKSNMQLLDLFEEGERLYWVFEGFELLPKIF